MRTKVNPDVRTEVSGRFVELVENHLRIPWPELERYLGYSNRSSLDAIRSAKTLPGADKLCLVAKLRSMDGRRANIDWLFSSEGTPLLDPPAKGDNDHSTTQIKKRIAQEVDKLQPEQRSAILEVIRLLSRGST